MSEEVEIIDVKLDSQRKRRSTNVGALPPGEEDGKEALSDTEERDKVEYMNYPIENEMNKYSLDRLSQNKNNDGLIERIEFSFK